MESLPSQFNKVWVEIVANDSLSWELDPAGLAWKRLL